MLAGTSSLLSNTICYSSVRGGFEPPVPVKVRLVSSEFRSATPAPHQNTMIGDKHKPRTGICSNLKDNCKRNIFCLAISKVLIYSDSEFLFDRLCMVEQM